MSSCSYAMLGLDNPSRYKRDHLDYLHACLTGDSHKPLLATSTGWKGDGTAFVYFQSFSKWLNNFVLELCFPSILKKWFEVIQFHKHSCFKWVGQFWWFYGCSCWILAANLGRGEMIINDTSILLVSGLVRFSTSCVCFRCLRWLLTLYKYHGKSPSNHHLGNVFICSNCLKQI